MFEYKLGDNYYTAEQVQQAAKQSNMSLEDYIKKSGIQTSTPQIQPLTEETEELKKAKEVKSSGLDLYKVTPEEEEELKANYKTKADELFIPKKDFPQKFLRYSDYTGKAVMTTDYPEGYYQYYNNYIDRAKKYLSEENAKEEDVFEVAKNLYIKDNLKQELSKRVEKALRYDELSAPEKPNIFSANRQKFLGTNNRGQAMIVDEDENEGFKQSLLEASTTIKDVAKKDIDIISNNLEVYKRSIENISQQQRQISSGKYLTQQELQEAKKRVNNLQTQKEAVADAYSKSYDKLFDQVEILEEEELLIDVLKRKYGLLDVVTGDAIASVSMLASQALALPQWLVDVTTVDGFGDGKMVLAGGIAMEKLAKAANPYSKGLKTVEDNLRSMVAKPREIKEVKSFKDLGYWAADVTGNQLPVMAALYFMPNYGLTVLSAASAGGKYQEMIQDEFNTGKEYNNLELFLAPVFAGLAEYGSEYVTAAQLGRVRGLMAKNDTVLQAARDYVSNTIKKTGALNFIGDTLAEGTSEALAQLSNNLVDITILDKDKSVWEGVDNAFASGAFMSSVIYKAPLYGSKLIAPFMEKKTKAKLRGNLAMIDLIVQETIKEDINPETKIQLEEQLALIIKDNNMLLSKTFEEIDALDFDELGADRKQEIIDNEIKARQANSKISEIMLDENFDPELKDKVVEDLFLELQQASNRIEEIKDEAKRARQLEINNPYQDLSESEVEVMIDKDIEKANSIVKQLGLNEKVEIIPVKNQQEIVENLEKLEASQERIEAARVRENIGLLHISNKDGKNYIFINKANAKSKKKVDPARHELLHAILRTSFNFNDEAAISSGNQLLEFVNTFITKDKKLRQTSFGERFIRYYDLYKQGSYPIGNVMEEVFPILSDAMAKGDITYNPSLLQKLGDFSRQSLQRLGVSEINFEKPSDIFKFVLDYNENYKNSSFGKAFKSFALNGISGRIKITPTNVEKTFDQIEGDRSLNDQIDDLVGPKDENGNYTITYEEWIGGGIKKAYDLLVSGTKIDALIARGFVGQVYGQSIQNFIHDIKYSVNGNLTDILLKFDPQKNDSLIGYINSQLKFARMKVAEQYRIELANKTNFTPELERTLASRIEDGDSDIVQNEIQRQRKLIDVSDLIPNSEKEFQEKVAALNIIGLYFKSVPNLVSESLASLLGVKENKILNPQDNLSTQELSNIQDFIFKNINTIMKVMPLAYVKEGASIEFMDKSTGVPASLLNLLYKKVDGKWEKNNDISKEEVLAGFGINADGTKVENLSPRATEGQRAKAIISLLGRLATNTKLRKHAKERNLSPQQVLDIQSGKSPAMYDIGDMRSRRAEEGEHQTVVDTLFLYEKEIDQLYTGNQVSEKDGINLLIKAGLNENQAKDLHSALNNYIPRENIKRLKDGGFVKSFMTSINYIHYNYERSIKGSMGLIGEDIVELSGGLIDFRNKVVGDFLSPMFDSKNSSFTPIEAVNMMRFIYHHFYRPTKEFYELNGIKTPLDKKAVPAIFETKEQFVLFFNNNAIKQSSPIHQYVAKINLDGDIEINFKDNLAKSEFEKDYSVVLNPKEKRYDPRTSNLHNLEEFHNGQRTEIEILANHTYSSEKAREDLKKFFLVLDSVKSNTLEYGLYRDQEIFDKKSIAGLIINMLYNNSGAINHMYKVTSAVKNNNAPKNIKKENVSLYYKLEKNYPTSNFAKIFGLYLLDKEFDINSLLASMEAYTAAFVPSNEIKMQVTPEELNKIEEQKRNKIKTKAAINEKRFSGQANALDDLARQEQDKLNAIEDRVSLSISSLGPKKKYRSPEAAEKEIGPELPKTKGVIQEAGKKKEVERKKNEAEKDVEGTFIFKNPYEDKTVNVIPLSNIQKYPYDKAVLDYENYGDRSTVQKVGDFFGIEVSGVFINPETADYDALVQALFRKGGKNEEGRDLGKEDAEFFLETIKKPYIEANIKLNALEVETQQRFKNVKANNKEAFDILDEVAFNSQTGVYYNEDLIKIFLYNKAGHEVLEEGEVSLAIRKLKNNQSLYKLAKDMLNLYPVKSKVWSKPTSGWKGKTLGQEIADAVRTDGRAEIFADWVEIKNAAFSENNLNKIRALYGKRYYHALKGMLDRMESGIAFPMKLSSFEQQVLNWARGSISNVMFWNFRSASLQLLSLLNYIDIENNNPVEVMKTLNDFDQYVSDVAYLWSSPYLQSRRGGGFDLNQEELEKLTAKTKDKDFIDGLKKSLEGGLKNPGSAIVNLYRYLLRNGFKLTQWGDSTAISVGGALYLGTMRRKYNSIIDSLPLEFEPRNEPVSSKKMIDQLYDVVKEGDIDPESKNKNKIIKYVKKNKQENQKLYKELIEELAFEDFYEKTEESQQSARQDRLSLEQVSIGGRFLLGFQNTPIQYNRIILKAIDDVRNNRGSKRNNLARIVYYGFAQNLAFSFIQNGLLMQAYTAIGSEEEEEKLQEELWDKFMNGLKGSMQTIIRGFGLRGSLLYGFGLVGYNYIKVKSEGSSYYDVSQAMVDLSAMSPSMNIKMRQAKRIYDTAFFSSKQDRAIEDGMWRNVIDAKDISSKLRYGLYNPDLDHYTDMSSLLFNSPLNRVLKKARNVSEALRKQQSLVYNFALTLGWDNWSLGIDYKEYEKQKKRYANRKKSTSKRKKFF